MDEEHNVASTVICENCSSKMKSIYRNMSRREKVGFYRCPQCGLIWTPELNVNTSFESKLDEESRQAALKNIRLQEFDQVNSLIEKYVPTGSRGLDVGCAYGWYMDSVSAKYEMEGIEPEEVIASQARKDVHKVYTGFFPKDMPENVGQYDFIVFNNVWEHINHTSELIMGSVPFVYAEGYFVITVPLSSGALYKISEILERIGRTKELVRLWQLHFHSPHVYYFSKKNFVRLMAKYNFSLQECQDVRGIDPKRMKERFEMDVDEQHGGIKAGLFRMAYPLLKQLPADKAVFVFRYDG